MSTTLIYIAPTQQAKAFKQRYSRITTLKIGSHPGLGVVPDYFDSLELALESNKDGLDLILFDLPAIEKITGCGSVLIAVLGYIKKKLNESISFVIFDPEGVINDAGEKLLKRNKVSVVKDLLELGPVFKDSEEEPSTGTEPFRYEKKSEEPSTPKKPIIEEVKIERHTIDPFADLFPETEKSDGFEEPEMDDVDPFSALDDAFESGKSEDFDDFFQSVDELEESVNKDSLDFPDEIDDVFEEEAEDIDFPFDEDYGSWNDAPVFDTDEAPSYEELKNGYSGDYDEEDYARLLSIKEPEWDYSQVNEDKSPALFGGKKKKKRLGEVEPTMLANSNYIPEKEAEHGYYSAPDGTQIILAFSPKGGVGKAFPLSEKIPRENKNSKTLEWTTIGNIEAGDMVYAPDGSTTQVMGVYPQGELESYRVHFEDGRSVVCSDNHLWKVRFNGEYKVVPLRELINEGTVGLNGKLQFSVPVTAPVEMSEVDENGGLSPVVAGSVFQRLSLLKSFSKNPLGISSGAYTLSVEGNLKADMISDLVRSLGFLCEKDVSGSNDNSFILTIRHDSAHLPGYDGNPIETCLITEIEDLGISQKMSCLKVRASNGLFLVGNFIVTHNTTVSTMLGVQLNWYFNRDLMMGRTTSQSSRVLVLSLNEFDDISVNDVGYTSAVGHDNDGKNIAELKNRIEECGGNPEWDDISHCFAASPENFVFYLPSLTLKEKLTANINITAADYKKIIEVCSRFFQFIVLDSPDIFTEQKDDLMSFAFNISDVIVFVIEADTRSTTNLFTLFDGLKASNNGKSPLDKNKCLLVVNKYAVEGNPYLGYTPERPQIPFEKIVTACRNNFKNAVALPLTEYRSYGNILFGRDPKVKEAAADLADKVLEIIDDNAQGNNALNSN